MLKKSIRHPQNTQKLLLLVLLLCFLIACAKAIVQLLSADYKNIKNFVIVGKGRFLMIPKESIDTLETSENSTMVYDTMTM